MKKIMFNDQFALTQAVLDGAKTMTRRPIQKKVLKGAYAYVQRVHGTEHDFLDYLLEHAPYKVGDMVAVARSYRTLNENGYVAPEWCDHTCEDSAGYENKMYVKAGLMPDRIRITAVRVERIQDISKDDCQREGIVRGDYSLWGYKNNGRYDTFRSWKDAFASLIKKLCGKQAWDDNPYVFVCSFTLLK